MVFLSRSRVTHSAHFLLLNFRDEHKYHRKKGIMRHMNKADKLRKWTLVKRRFRSLRHRRIRPALEMLEQRVTPSVGGGWISSTQSGQSGDGLLGQYYTNSTLSGTPSFTRWDDRVDFSWPDSNADPGGSPDPAFGSVGPNNWSAEWTGTLTANFSETYTFQINSAGNGVRLWVTPVGQQQGNPIINDWTSHGPDNRHGHHDPPGRPGLQRRARTLRDHRERAAGSASVVQPEHPAGGHRAGHAGRPERRRGRRAVRQHGQRRHPHLSGGPRETRALRSRPTATSGRKRMPRFFSGKEIRPPKPAGSYLVQFTGMATVTDWPQNVDWWVNGTDLHSSTLQAGQGYNPSTNTTTATMVVSPGANAGFYMTFTNTSRNPNSAPGHHRDQ